MMRGRACVELRLKVLTAREPDVKAIRFGKDSRKPRVRFKVRAPNGAKVGATFQNGLESRMGIEAVNNSKKHQARLSYAKMVKQLDTGGCSEWSQNIHHQDHGMQELKIGLQDFVLELTSKQGSESTCHGDSCRKHLQ